MKTIAKWGMAGLLSVLAGQFLFTGCSSNNTPAATAPVTVQELVTATFTPTGSPTSTFTITWTPTSTWTPVTIIVTPTATFTPTFTDTGTFTFTPTITWTPTITNTPTDTNTPNNTPSPTPTCGNTIGKTVPSSGSAGAVNGAVLFNQFVAGGNYNVTYMHARLYPGHSSCNITMAIYTNSAGAPAALLNQTNSTACVDGVNNVAIPSTALSSGVTYWLGVELDSSGGWLYLDSGASNNYIVNPYSYGVFPGTAPGGGFANGAQFDVWGDSCSTY